MEPAKFAYDLGIVLSILAIYVLSEIVALYVVQWTEHLAESRHLKRVR
jgi:hypothetical protein